MIYRDFFKDFPARCSEILTAYLPDAVKSEQEVTLLLCVAAAGIVIPHERLKKKTSSASTKIPHPAGDILHDPTAAEKYQSSLTSELILQVMKEWELGEITINWAEPPSWPCELPQGKTDFTGDVIETMRKALAHGNIWTEPDAQGKIDSIVFLSAKDNAQGGYREGTPVRFSYIKVGPEKFTAFLHAWLKLLGE
jgi:hypothetical protein